ncbi:MAG: ABC transporter permease [Spirochaetales bacterium]|uniref:ABC transporter permease n=1 Tax=Candidatus Thalassospirochaeta sargassi TaxID=3119039 RepID=A0AAJ1IFK6_9SPIO|nr:ABC transporter permease [Spirochaetales bacterium]
MTLRIARTAFKNIARNKRRSILSGAAIAVAAMSIVILFAFIGGMSKDMENNLRSYYTGDVNIRNVDYEEYERFNPVHLTVNIDDAESAISNTEGINAWVPRTTFGTSIYIDGTNHAAVGVGADFEREAGYIDLEEIVKAGRLPEAGKNEMIMGTVLAENLHFSIGDKVTIMTMTASRGTNAMTLEITGLAAFPVAALNSNNLWIPLDRVQHLLQTPEAAQQIMIETAEGYNRSKVAENISAALTAAGTPGDVNDMENMSLMFGMLKLADMIYNVIAAFFFILGSTVIINTTMMVIFERMREIGTLSALGMHGKELVRLFLLEGAFISAVGAAAGVVLGIIITLYLGRVGIDFTDAMQGVDMEISAMMYPVLSIPKTIFVYFYSVIIACLATLVPSRKASRIQPVEALRYI